MNETLDLMSPKEVAHLFGVTERTAQRWAVQGIMGGFRVGGQYRFVRDRVMSVIPQKPTRATRQPNYHCSNIERR